VNKGSAPLESTSPSCPLTDGQAAGMKQQGGLEEQRCTRALVCTMRGTAGCLSPESEVIRLHRNVRGRHTGLKEQCIAVCRTHVTKSQRLFSCDTVCVAAASPCTMPSCERALLQPLHDNIMMT
jgi:hypothetical protein